MFEHSIIVFCFHSPRCFQVHCHKVPSWPVEGICHFLGSNLVWKYLRDYCFFFFPACHSTLPRLLAMVPTKKGDLNTSLPVVWIYNFCLCACVQIKFIYLVNSTKTTMLTLTLVCAISFLLVCSGAFFPYSSNPANPKPKRVFLQVRALRVRRWNLLHVFWASLVNGKIGFPAADII